MAYDEMLERRSEMLKRRIGEMIARENQYGLGKQEGLFLRRMIKEWHQMTHEMNGKPVI
ncbi:MULTISPECIES: hypothetical protein [Paenibacillus]|uniref:Aspartyl-phosphate phosphatase Spo0E family protein n=1 Tax=Paenibacillus vini TaxID=1476024 RepID=A0ABQ4MDC2_9BACL|nr:MULTISPECIES: hypothetical protein [Paenibacillus]MBQ4899165.1 hypothetical protein [Paenibacillus sp. Marseille-P2973]MDN4068623.1 hypothetical protein [Paenibacillus vini]GIP53987.1 hypothetical protein J42TS3_30220 [Paenibacillus vini]